MGDCAAYKPTKTVANVRFGSFAAFDRPVGYSHMDLGSGLAHKAATRGWRVDVIRRV
jgi:hypothetical protein